ncbi:MAG: hypothetical protein ACFBSE_13950 [Prochloraceae cyanobacterium]
MLGEDGLEDLNPALLATALGGDSSNLANILPSLNQVQQIAQVNTVTPQCANPATETPLTKARLDQIYAQQIAAGVNLRATSALAFEDFALSTIKPGRTIPRNTKKFDSPARDAIEGIRNVVPDGVTELTVFNPLPRIFNESIFYEAKAIRPGITNLEPSYENSQILGFLDALGKTPAAIARENPAIVFINTADISRISSATVNLATRQNIGVYHAIGCEITNSPGSLRIGRAELTNPQVYINTRRVPTNAGGPGTIDTLRFS